MSQPVDPRVLEPVKALWMTGGAAKSAAPDAWSAQLDSVAASEAELRLLALVGQASQIALVPKCQRELTFRNGLPKLQLPVLEEQFRPAFRRILGADKKKDRLHRLITFLASRGWVAHPLDWLPNSTESGEGLPEVYAPWIDWVSRARWSETDADMVPDEENWHDFYPAERIKALRVLRRQNAAEVPRLFLAKFPEENAEIRFRHLPVLADELGDHDVELLESLGNDRSERVRNLAHSYLARLGKVEADPGAIEGLNDFFKKVKGRLKKTSRIDPIPAKNKSAWTRLAKLCQSVPLASLAEAFEMTPEEVIDGWKFKVDDRANCALSAMLAFSASDSQFDRYLTHLIAERWFDADGVAPLLDRFTDDHRLQLLEGALQNSDLEFGDLTSWIGGCVGKFPAKTIKKSKAWKRLLEVAGINENENRIQTNNLDPWLFTVGLLVDRESAPELIDILNQRGIDQFDPRLQLLQFNASLPTSSS